MKKTFSLLLFFTVLLPWFGTSPSAGTPKVAQTVSLKNRKALDQFYAAYTDAVKKREPAAFADLFTENGVLINRAGVFRGKAKILEFAQNVMKARTESELTITPAEAGTDGGTIFEYGEYTSTLTSTDDQKTVRETGRYLGVFHRERNGSVKIRVLQVLPVSSK